MQSGTIEAPHGAGPPGQASRTPVEPRGGGPPAAKHVAAPQPKPSQPAGRLSPIRFKPKFPDAVDLLADRPVKRRWPAQYYIIAAVIHLVVFAIFGYRILVQYQTAKNTTPFLALPPMKQVGEGVAPIGPEFSLGDSSRSMDKPVNAAPKVLPTPSVPRGSLLPRNLPAVPTAPLIIATANPRMPGMASGGSSERGQGGTADTLAGRVSGASRGAAVRRFGGSDAAEAAVLKALRWLKKNQNLDKVDEKKLGSWGSQYHAAMTGLALLAFLGHGETHDSEEFSGPVREGLNYLYGIHEQAKAQNGNGGYMGTARFEYQHPIAAYALCEDYALTRFADLKPLCESVIELIARAQRPDGSWDYDYNTGPGGVYNLKNRPSGDSSIAAWNVQALVAAKNAGLRVQGLDEALGRARFWFHNIFSKDQERFGYAMPDRGFSEALDGIGILCLQLLGEGDCAEVRKVLPKLLNTETRYRDATANSPYGWYYITQAMFHAGGHWWADWNARLRDQIVDNQSPDGSWPPPGGAAWQDNMTSRKVSGKDSKVYHTTLMCLALEVYYRFLPTYSITEIARRHPPASPPAR